MLSIKKYICTTDEEGVQNIWDFSQLHNMLVEFVGKKGRGSLDYVYTYRLTMDEELASVFALMITNRQITIKTE